MISVFLLLMSALALVGIFFNIRMLIFGCIKMKMNHSTLRKLRPFVVLQFICQVTILVITTIQAVWRGLRYVQLEESYIYVFKTLVISVLILLAFNVVAIYVLISSPDHPEASKRRQFLSMLLVPATLLFAVTVSAVLRWYGHEVGLQGMLIAILVVLLLLTLFVQFSDLSTLAQLEEVNEPMESTSPCITIKENKELILIVSLAMLSCGGMIAFVFLPGIFNEILSKENVIYLHMLMVNLCNGLTMPFGLIYFLNQSSWASSNGMKEAGMIV